MPASPPSPTGLDPAALLAIRDLELRARVVVEGLWAGLHRSPFAGFSVEFSEYRAYSPGDDVRHLDWKVLARTDREFLRKFEDETNLRCHLLVDLSGSMEFGSLGYSKRDYARTLAGSLAHFLLGQRDMVGLAVFDERVAAHVPARWRPGHLRRLLAALDRPPTGATTRLEAALDEAARLWRRRGLVVLVSDLLPPVESWDAALGRLVACGHDVRVIQVLDPAETDLDFGHAAEWEDMEDGRRLFTDPARARPAYAARFARHQEAVGRALQARGVAHHLARTDEPIDVTLHAWLRGVARRGRARPATGRISA